MKDVVEDIQCRYDRELSLEIIVLFLLRSLVQLNVLLLKIACVILPKSWNLLSPGIALKENCKYSDYSTLILDYKFMSIF